MSASTERKNRAAAREAGTDKKMLAQQEAEKKAAKSRRQCTVGAILVAILLIVIILFNTGFFYKYTPALTIGKRNYSPAELSYSYSNQYLSFVNQYGSYASLFGLDTSGGIATLDHQSCPMLEEGKTWRDYFMEGAMENLKQVTALKAYADENGIRLDEDELAVIDADLASLDETARSYGYSNANRFLAANYGTGVNKRLARSMAVESALASKALQAYTDSLEYSDEQLEEYYASLEGASDYFDYLSFFVAAETVPVEGAEGEDAEAAPTEQTLLEARMTAEAIEMAYKDGYDIEDPAERLGAAVEAESDAAFPEEHERESGDTLGDLSAWMTDSARKSGDVGVIEASDGTGYTVAVFLSRDDNHYPTVSVRHILIKAEAAEDGTYTDEAKQAALEKINAIRAEFDAGDRTEESFAALAEQYSEDAGSNTKGGLYEDIYKGQMVQEFNDFCFGGRKSGDVGIVYGESGAYAGYHLIYFVGEGELYSNTLAEQSLRSADAESWLSELTGSYTTGEGFGMKFVG